MLLTTELVAELLDPARQPVIGAALEVEALQRVSPVGIKTCIVSRLEGVKATSGDLPVRLYAGH